MISIKSSTLRDALKQVGKSVDRRSVLAVLHCVRIRVDGESFEMIAACPEGQSTYREERFGDTDKRLDICVAPDRLAPALGFAGDYIDVSVQKNGRAKFSGSNGSVALPIYPGEMFPLIKPEGEVIADIDVIGLSGIVSSVAFAANAKDIREPMRGIWIESDGQQISATATNGYMLATAQITIASTPFGVLLPQQAAEMLADLETTRLIVTKSHVTACGGNTELVLKPMSAKYPDWRRTLPEPKNFISFESEPLREAVSMHRFYGDKMGAVKFTSEGTECAIEIVNSDHEANISLDADEIHGDEPFNFTFRGDQLAQILTRAPAEKVTFYWDAKKPRAFLVQNGNWRGVVSPLIV